MNDERFFELAMKVIAQQATDAERAELDARLVREPELKPEFERLQAEVRIARDALPLVNATKATAGELPAYARGRLQTKVRQTLGRPVVETEPDHSLAWGWRWALGLAATAAVVLLVALPMFRTPNSTNTRVAVAKKTTITGDSNTHEVALLNKAQHTPTEISPTNSDLMPLVTEKLKAPVIQLAMLDIVGGTRGSDTNETGLVKANWPTATLDSFTTAEALREWQSKGKPDVVKVIYDHAAAEVNVFGKWRGKSFEKTFVIERDLATTLIQAKAFIAEQTKE